MLCSKLVLVYFTNELMTHSFEYFRSNFCSNSLIINRDTKQDRKCASILSSVQTNTGLVSNSDLVILNVSSIFHNPL